MGKAFTTAARWFAPLSAMLALRRTNPTTLNDATLCTQAPSLTSPRVEVAPGTPQAAQDLVGITIQQEPAFAALEARTDRGLAPASPPAHAAPAAPRLRPLRVLRIRESCPQPRQAGRLVISGRMADVCAELERLSAAHPGLVH